MPPVSRPKPSRHFCETGNLDIAERFDSNLHNQGETPYARCESFYPGEYAKRELDMPPTNHVAGKTHTRNIRKKKRTHRKTLYKRRRGSQRRR